MDHRSKRVDLTDSAPTLWEPLEEELSKAPNETFSILSADELDTLHELLGRVRGYIGEKVNGTPEG